MMRVLIASDETVRALLTSSLTRYGYQIVCISDGDAARKIVESGLIDVCVLDWELAGMGAPDLCRYITSSCVTPAPYLIAVVPDQSDQVAAAYRAGAHELFAKPFDSEQVASRIFALNHSRNL
jgi:DNA-binding response OmpR family regulator